MTTLQYYKILFLLILLVSIFTTFFSPPAYASLIPANPLVSRDAPATASDDCFTSAVPGHADNSIYSDFYRSCTATPSAGTPVTLTYDLSSIAVASRKKVVVAWYNDPQTGAYDYTLISAPASNIPKDYTIQANAAAGGGSTPSTGWVTLQTVTGNVYHSRQVQVDLTGYNWIRLSATASNGGSGNQDIAVNMDIHDVSQGITDDWMFFGDSITQQAFLHNSSYGGTFSQAINTFNSSYYPIYESGGEGGFVSGDAASNINTWLPLSPEKFVTLNYGTNDANTGVSASTFYTNMKTMVDAVIAAGKIPIIPKIPWGCTTNLTNNVPTMNAQIDTLYSQYPKIIKGPDLYTYFNNHQSDLSGDCIHMTDPAGYTDYLTQWINSMETAVYTLPVVSVSPGGGNVSTTQSVTLSSTKSGIIYFTLDGSTPSTASAVYSSPISITSTKTVKAMIVDQAGNVSTVVSNTYTFPVPTATPTVTPTPSSTNKATNISTGGGSPNPNSIPGWNQVIMTGPHFFGTNSFISGNGDAAYASLFIPTSALRDDAFVSITKSSLISLEMPISPVIFPWAQGFNTASDIYNFSVIAAFNGYPITTFETPVTIVLPYDPGKLYKTSPQSLRIAWYNPSVKKWQVLTHNTVFDFKNHTLANTTKHSGYYVIVMF